MFLEGPYNVKKTEKLNLGEVETESAVKFLHKSYFLCRFGAKDQLFDCERCNMNLGQAKMGSKCDVPKRPLNEP